MVAVPVMETAPTPLPSLILAPSLLYGGGLGAAMRIDDGCVNDDGGEWRRLGLEVLI